MTEIRRHGDKNKQRVIKRSKNLSSRPHRHTPGLWMAIQEFCQMDRNPGSVSTPVVLVN